ncbi:hypothetical protein [Candidatus Cetobacterium colombiensis]|uniref:Uncharacterized protein n=1 Tax=Candidatus Cetobacterium colombiensis TaxID=3073100 RepID=A0ABU4WD93_9FUSO|nr:hypothetical protein [Candidatus Cetobacterium colombiensis]MDX8337487.1 hypothetical protein [Candidatus Cetobacterium colombiensis]
MKKLLIIGTLVLGSIAFAANGTGRLAGNAQPNGVTRMAANNGVCVVTGTTERANKGEFVGPGRGQGQGRGRMAGKGQGRMLNNQATTPAAPAKTN